jgi:hypothetical protein
MLIGLSCVTRNDWGVVEVVDETASMTREQNLLLSSLNDCSQMNIKSLLELLSGLSAES